LVFPKAAAACARAAALVLYTHHTPAAAASKRVLNTHNDTDETGFLRGPFPRKRVSLAKAQILHRTPEAYFGYDIFHLHFAPELYSIPFTPTQTDRRGPTTSATARKRIAKKRPRGRPLRLDIPRAAALRDEGLQWSAIATVLDVSLPTVKLHKPAIRALLKSAARRPYWRGRKLESA
jgi:hypothetical protein